MAASLFVFCLLAVLVLVLQPCQSFFDFDFDTDSSKSCELIPYEVNLFVGEAVKIYANCTDSTDVQFAIEVRNTDDIIELNTTVLNSTHVVTILEGSEKLKGRTTLTLFGKENGDINLEEELSSMNFFVLERLQNVTDVYCIWHFSKHQFDVHWKLGVNYSDPVIVNSQWIATDRRLKDLYNCTRSDETSCHLDKLFFPSIVFFHIFVKVDDFWLDLYRQNEEYFVQPQIREFPHLVFKVYPREHVKPERPRKFEMTVKSSRCVDIKWTNDEYFTSFNESVLFRITFFNHGQISKTTNDSILPPNKFGNTQTECGLEPNTRYTVQLRVKPEKGGYWSEPAEHEGTTLEDIPSHGPRMTNTSFWVSVCNNGVREVILYWKELHPNEANGVLTNFLVTLNSVEGEVRHGSNHMKAEVACNETLDVAVFSRTKVGLTLNPSRLVVPAEKNVLRLPFLVDLKVEKLAENYEANLMDVNVTWSKGDDWVSSPPVFLVLYFCQGQTFSNEICLDDYQFKVVPLEDQFVELRDIPDKTDRFGYALEQDQNNLSGITWTDCIYDRNKQPRQVTGVMANPGEKLGSILVVWNAQRCSKDTVALVLLYRVKYCTPSQQCQVKNVEGGDSSLLLIDLDVHLTYSITVSAKAFSKEGPASLPVTSSPYRSAIDGSGGVTDIAIVLIIIILLIVASIICCVVWRVKKRKEKIQEIIFTPLHPTHQSKETNLQQKDSGISTVTLTSVVDAPNCDTCGVETQDSSYAVIKNSFVPSNDVTPQEDENIPVCSVGLTPPIYHPPDPKDDFGAEAVELDSIKQETHFQNNRHNEALMGVNDSHSNNRAPDSTDGYVDQSNPCQSYVHAGINSENDDKASINSLSMSSGSENDADSTQPIQPFEIDIKNMFSVKMDQSPVINNHDKGSKEQCSNSSKKESALANKSCSGEISLSSLNPYSYLHVTALGNSNTDSLSDKTSGNQSDFVTDTGKEEPFTNVPKAGGDVHIEHAPVATFQVHNPDPYQTIFLNGQNGNFDVASNTGNQFVSDASVEALDSSPESSDDQSTELSDIEPYVGGYVDQKDLIKPPLCERKISEDEGISSPGVFTDSPNFVEKTEAKSAKFIPDGLPVDLSSIGPAVHHVMVEVDVTGLQNCVSYDDAEDDNSCVSNNSCVLESRNNDDEYTNPSFLENGSSGYV